jgi:hypothetical protein
MLKSRLAKLILAAIVLAGVWYYWTPRRAWDRFLTAVVMADAQRLQATVDFPVLRQNLKDDIGASLTAKSSSGFGAVIASGLVEQMVNVTITPRGMAQLITGFGTRTPRKGDVDSVQAGSITSIRYRSPSRVEVRIRPADEDDSAAGVVTLSRTGLTWRVTRISSDRLTNPDA